MNVTIRQAQKTDAEGIIKHIKVIAGETNHHTLVPEEFNPAVEDEAKVINDLNESENSLILLVDIENEIVGILTLVGGNRSRTKHCASLGISIQQKHCGMGIGHQLIDHMNQWVEKNSPITKVNFVVHEENTKAIKFYETLGFKYEGRSPMYFNDNGDYYDGIFMGKSYIK